MQESSLPYIMKLDRIFWDPLRCLEERKYRKTVDESNEASDLNPAVPYDGRNPAGFGYPLAACATRSYIDSIWRALTRDLEN
jgi:hypothetical protein